MITGAVILLVGLLVGYLFGRAMNRAKASTYKPPKEPKPICGCTHHYAMRAGADGTCHEVLYRGEDGNGVSRYEQCTCQRYIGPEPLPLIIPGPGGAA